MMGYIAWLGSYSRTLLFTVSALKRVQRSSRNVQTPLQNGALLVSALCRK